MGTRDKLKQLRATTGLSQAKFSDHFSIPTHTYESWEMGIRKPPMYVVKMIETILDYESKEKL